MACRLPDTIDTESTSEAESSSEDEAWGRIREGCRHIAETKLCDGKGNGHNIIMSIFDRNRHKIEHKLGT